MVQSLFILLLFIPYGPIPISHFRFRLLSALLSLSTTQTMKYPNNVATILITAKAKKSAERKIVEFIDFSHLG